MDYQRTPKDRRVDKHPIATESYRNHRAVQGAPDLPAAEFGLAVASNQKMNEYLKEVGTLCGIATSLNTHRARRTFGSAVTLNNGVPIHIVKELLGHQSVKQTEEYAITEQRSVGREMKQLHQRMSIKETPSEQPASDALTKMQQEIQELKEMLAQTQKALQS